MDGDETSQLQMDDTASNSSKRAKMDGCSDSDRLLNFATAADEFELSLKRHKIPRDPMSHRIIEKRRRDRMNNCLADLSRLIPASYHKQGQGRIEKTEIIEMATKHINLLQQRADDMEKKVLAQEKATPMQGQLPTTSTIPPTPSPQPSECSSNQFYMGFKEAQDEVMRFLVEVESINTMDPFCKKIMKHLENASQKFVKERDIEKTELSPMESDCCPQHHIYPHTSFDPTSSTGLPSVTEDVHSGSDPKRDKHLRYLLGDQPGGQSMTTTNADSGEERRGSIPMMSYSSHLSSVGSMVESSGYISDASNLEKTSPNGSTSSRDNVYKFKHNITKRFSEEGHRHHRYSHQHNQPSDTSSNTSSRDLEDDQGQLRWKGGRKKNGCIYADDTRRENISSNSDECNSGSNSSHRGSTKGGPTVHSSAESQPQSLSVPGTTSTSSVALPGFILHPSGTHYMPISVHNTNVADLFESSDDQCGMPVFHPISIPVHFRRPVISMPDITICTHINSQKKDHSKD